MFITFVSGSKSFALRLSHAAFSSLTDRKHEVGFDVAAKNKKYARFLFKESVQE